jgi:transposase
MLRMYRPRGFLRYEGNQLTFTGMAYKGHPLSKRQLCWAHLQRDFQAMVDRGGPAAEVGRLLLLHAEVVFGWWHWVREGHGQRTTFQRRLQWLRCSLRAALEQST